MIPIDEASVQVRVVGLAGSLRAGSATRMAVRYALRGAEGEGAVGELLDLESLDLPFLGLDAGESSARKVRRFRDLLGRADGIVLGSPEIHGSLSGVLKNALDLATSEECGGKMVGLVGVAGGQLGAAETLSHLRSIGRSLRAWVVPTQVSIAASEGAFDSAGEPIDPQLVSRLKLVGWQVAHFARLHKCEKHLQFLKEWEGTPANG